MTPRDPWSEIVRLVRDMAPDQEIVGAIKTALIAARREALEKAALVAEQWATGHDAAFGIRLLIDKTEPKS